MDARVNDFFNEINEIVPPVTKVRSTSECVWQECFDDTSGYPYYWNMHTNVVTWEMPPEYQAWLDKTKVSKTIQHESTDTNSKGPLFPSVTKSSHSTGETKTITASKCSSSSQDVKKISLLSAYSVDSDHDSREANSLSRNGSNTNSPFHSSRANSDAETVDEVKPTLGFSLLANYGNYSDEEEEDSHDESQDAPKTPQNEAHSTLFPITKPIDVKQFTQETNDKELPQETEEIDVKAFKRKRRIGVHLVNHPKREVIIETKNDTTETSNAENLKKKFSMNFIQGDTLQPTISSNSNDEESNDSDMVATQTTLKEKLAFLSEGKDAISPVQIMSIQLEILFIAWRSGNLNTAYFSSWIKDVSSNLIKLEEDATPEGWNLEWDRQEKRYFYRNKSSDACQWEYPQPSKPTEEVVELNGGQNVGKVADDDDDAMDICTTPPPMDAQSDGSNIEVTTICASATDETHKDDASKRHDAQALSSELDSFYSHIAAIETEAEQQEVKDASKPKTPEIPTQSLPPAKATISEVKEVKDNPSAEPVKKKRKVKMSQGISMKKKGVSQLVEKWKNVQKDLD